MGLVFRRVGVVFLGLCWIRSAIVVEEFMVLLSVGGCWENWSWEFGRSSPKDMVASSWTDSESLIRLMVGGWCVVRAEEVVRIWRLRRRASSCRIWKSFC